MGALEGMEDVDMMDARAYLACAPMDAGVGLALFYVSRAARIHGWFAREHEGRFAAAFFALEGCHATDDAIFRRSVDDDACGRWIGTAAPAATEVRCPLSDAEREELARLRAAFCREWLFEPDDPRDRAEVEAYRRLELPLHPVNVRPVQFRRFDRSRPVWVYASAGIDFDLVLYLKQRLPADRHHARVLP